MTWPACQNARDVGGYPTLDGRTVRWRALLRSDNPSRLTPEGQRQLESDGIQTVIDLRSPAELLIDPSPFRDAPLYHHMSIEDASDPEYQGARVATADVPTIYRLIVDRFGARFASTARAIADAPPGGVLIHCHAGKDRTGLLVAIVLSAIGVSAETIAADYALSDERLAKHYADELEDPALPADRRERLRRTQHARPATMLGILHHIGDAAGYLRAHGLTDDDLSRLRARLLD